MTDKSYLVHHWDHERDEFFTERVTFDAGRGVEAMIEDVFEAWGDRVVWVRDDDGVVYEDSSVLSRWLAERGYRSPSEY